MKQGEKYWTFFARKLNCESEVITLIIEPDIWRGSVAEHAKLKCGWIYKTHADAVLAIQQVAQELGMEYSLERRGE